MSGRHAELGASSRYRWKREACPGSVRLARGMPRTTNAYATEGNVAHDVAEDRLRRIFEPGYVPERAYLLGEIVVYEGYSHEVTREMLIAVDLYVETIKDAMRERPGASILIEARLDLSGVYPGMYGTADAVIVDPARREVLAYDFKYGEGEAVEVEGNNQLIFYLLGALLVSGAPAAQAVMVIVQPRAFHREGPVRQQTLTADRMLVEMEALYLDGLATDAPDAPTRVGPWCHYCPAAPICATACEHALTMSQQEFAPGKAYDPDELDRIVRSVPIIKAWAARVEAFAKAELIAGRGPSQHKLVRGRGTRVWERDEDAKNWLLLYQGIAESAIMTAPELRSVAQVEKLLDKDAKSEFKKLYRSLPGGLVMAPAEDKREAVAPGADAAAEFGVAEVPTFD